MLCTIHATQWFESDFHGDETRKGHGWVCTCRARNAKFLKVHLFLNYSVCTISTKRFGENTTFLSQPKIIQTLFLKRMDLCLVLLWVQNDFGLSKSFWSSSNGFGWVQFVLDHSKSFWTSVQPKPLFCFRSDTETETQIGWYFRPIP